MRRGLGALVAGDTYYINFSSGTLAAGPVSFDVIVDDNSVIIATGTVTITGGGPLTWTGASLEFIAPAGITVINFRSLGGTGSGPLLDDVTVTDSATGNLYPILGAPSGVPEPRTMLLFGAGLLAIGYLRRTR
jgi:hypothetical protein